MAGVGKERAQGQCFGKARISQRVRQAASVYDEPWDREDSAAEGKRFGERFASRVMPIFKRQSDAVRELILELYLYGLASVDFELALRELLGDGALLVSEFVATSQAEMGRGRRAVEREQAWRRRRYWL